jgi:thiol:disulfide interchange protein DsbA
MQKNRRHFLSASALLALSVAVPQASAQQNPPYVLISRPQPTENPGKIEVLEFFSYGCPHCYEAHPALKRWVAKLPAHVAFRRVPIIWPGRTPWNNLARLYYTLEQTGDLARLDDEVFAAVHEQRQNIYDEKRMTAWYVKQGGEEKKFTAAFNSFVVMNKMAKAERLAVDMEINTVPVLIVEGKYLIQGSTLPQQLANIEALVAQLKK